MAKKSSAVKDAVRAERMNARRSVIEELFNDYYDDRRNIYKMNFLRGIFFGLGSVLGGTVVIGLVVWGLSFFIHFPGIGDSIQKVQNSLESTRK